MNYEETLDFLYSSTPAFHQVGSKAYKPGLERTMELDKLLRHPHENYSTIHVAGTNGKGAVAHLLAAFLQASGYKVGLYTSPHLVDFRERIRVNGQPIPKQYVVHFVQDNQDFIQKKKPSFFEITSEMALDYFRYKKVRYAVIETGLGGRLDSTNIITPMMSVITSIGFDHTKLLGNTLTQIAWEKAGIIKRKVPAIIGEMNDAELDLLFKNVAQGLQAPIYFAREENELEKAFLNADGTWCFETLRYGTIRGELQGPAQVYNAQTVLTAIRLLGENYIQMRPLAVQKAFSNVARMTGLMARWQKIHDRPDVICDIGHNTGAWTYNSSLLEQEVKRHDAAYIVFGMADDKDADGVLRLLPKNAKYYFTQASIKRAMPADILIAKAARQGLKGEKYANVAEAVAKALDQASENDLIFIGGSTFVVAEAYPLFAKKGKRNQIINQ